MIPILIDPWITEISLRTSNTETFAKVYALNQVCDTLKNLYPLEILPFIDSETHSTFQVMLSNYKGRDRQTLRKYIHHFVLRNELDNELPIINEPCPDDLPESWKRVLTNKGNSDNPPHWRAPMLLVPQIRMSEWPANVEMTYTLNGTPRTRNLVTIESYKEHPYFERDIDPWRLRCVGEPRLDVPPHEMATTCRKLPRPPFSFLPLKLPLSQLAQSAGTISDCTCGTETHYYYLPHPSWNPIERGRDDWRNNAFARDGVVLRERGRRETGYRDRNDHIWVWDESEAYHWEVKTANDRRRYKVRYDGLILHS